VVICHSEKSMMPLRPACNPAPPLMVTIHLPVFPPCDPRSFIENRPEQLEIIIQQLAAAAPHRLGGAFSITYLSEPGIGDGPVREFLDSMKDLFSPG
jgi:hypothetical protein